MYSRCRPTRVSVQSLRIIHTVPKLQGTDAIHKTLMSNSGFQILKCTQRTLVFVGPRFMVCTVYYFTVWSDIVHNFNNGLF
jgi:hypothetical protein